MIRSLLLGGVAALAMTGAASATMVTVDVSDFGPAANFALIDDSFGDTGLVDFIWSAGPSGPAQFWNGQYSGNDAAWCGVNTSAVCSVTIANISPNHKMRLVNVVLGAYPDTDRIVNVAFLNSLGENFPLNGINVPSIGGAQFNNNLGGFVLPGGFYTLQWGPDGYNTGIISLTYEYERLQGEVSEPATLALLGAGLLGLAAVRRRRA